MLEMLRNLWNKAVEWKQELSFGSIFGVSLLTLNVVYPPAVLPTLLTLGTIAVGAALYFASGWVSSFFKKEEKAADAKADQKNDVAADADKDADKNNDAKKDSTVKMNQQLEDNKTADAGQEQEKQAEVAAAPSTAAPSTAANDADKDDVAAATLSM